MNSGPQLSEWQSEDIPMPFSIGVVGDIVWMYLPACRPGLLELVGRLMQLDIDNESRFPLGPINDGVIFSSVVNPIAKSALTDDVDPAEREQFLEYLGRALTYSGPGVSLLRHALHFYLLEWLLLPPYRMRLETLDTGLFRLAVVEYERED